MNTNLKRIPGPKFMPIPMGALVIGIGMVVFFNADLEAQIKEKGDSSGTHQVPVPGLGQNPWLIESFFKDLGVRDGRDGAIRDQLDALRKLLENQKVPIDPSQRQLLENLLKNPRASGGVDGLKDLAKGLISKADPAQQKLIREKLSNLGRAGGTGDLFSDLDKKQTGPNRTADNDSLQGGGVAKKPKPIDQDGNSKSIPSPFPDESPNLSGGASPSPIQRPNAGAPPVNSGAGPGINPKVGDLSRLLSRVLPFGLDKQVGPLGKEFLQKVAGWSSNIKLPESWKPGIQKFIRDLNLPGNLDNLAQPLPSGPTIGGSLSGSNMVLAFIVGIGLLVFVVWVASKWNWSAKENQPGSQHGMFVGRSNGFVDALEGVVIRLGGQSQAFGNHLKWKRDCGALLVARGMGEDLVIRLFEVYESAKYLGRQPGEDEELRLMEALNRHA